MKVLSCKIDKELYNEFKKENSNVSEALRELVVKSLIKPTSTASILRVYQQTPCYDINTIHRRVDEIIDDNKAFFDGVSK